MRINIGQTTNLFHVDALNKNMNSNEQEKKETKGINILPRKDVATISPMGKGFFYQFCRSLINFRYSFPFPF